MAQSNAIGRAQEKIQGHEARIETITRKREVLLVKIKTLGRTDMNTSRVLTEQVLMLEKERDDLLKNIKILRNSCKQAGVIETTVATQQHLDDLNLFMVQSMNTVGIARVKGINKDSEKIARDAKLFELHTSPDPDQEERENEASRRYLEELLGSIEEPSPTPSPMGFCRL